MRSNAPRSRLLGRPGASDAASTRARAGRIVEGHGDLRPEHSASRPAADHRLPGVLARSAHARPRRRARRFWRSNASGLAHRGVGGDSSMPTGSTSGDAPPAPLLAFYRGYRACVRATLAIRHLDEPAPREARKWPRARDISAARHRLRAHRMTQPMDAGVRRRAARRWSLRVEPADHLGEERRALDWHELRLQPGVRHAQRRDRVGHHDRARRSLAASTALARAAKTPCDAAA